MNAMCGADCGVMNGRRRWRQRRLWEQTAAEKVAGSGSLRTGSRNPSLNSFSPSHQQQQQQQQQQQEQQEQQSRDFHTLDRGKCFRLM